MKELMGIEISMMIADNNGNDITEAQSNEFLDKFIELVESFDWHCGGSCGRVDLNK